MLGWFRKDPEKVAQKEHAELLKRAMEAQRAGNIQNFARLSQLAEAKEKELLQLKKA